MYRKYYPKIIAILTNGVTEIKIRGFRYSCGIDPEDHTFIQDGYGNMFLDGLPAHVELSRM